MRLFLPKRLLPFQNLANRLTAMTCLLGLGVAAPAVVLLVTMAPATLAQRCTINCSSRQIQFTPGERIRILIVNRTSSLVQVEQVYGTNPIALLPSQEVEVDPNFGTRPNASLIIWDETHLPLRAVLFRPEINTLRVEILPGGRPPGDRSVYIENDGKVRIF
ncbi:MAG: hypothetical protein EDM05_57120 [Leptolyngbya sp. IPPAS B-1204]|nr:MAG: hypothetical protein EDM05_08635 [Leptolyngbya sp. IPPAS B-1204]